MATAYDDLPPLPRSSEGIALRRQELEAEYAGKEKDKGYYAKHARIDKDSYTNLSELSKEEQLRVIRNQHLGGYFDSYDKPEDLENIQRTFDTVGYDPVTHEAKKVVDPPKTNAPKIEPAAVPELETTLNPKLTPKVIDPGLDKHGKPVPYITREVHGVPVTTIGEDLTTVQSQALDRAMSAMHFKYPDIHKRLPGVTIDNRLPHQIVGGSLPHLDQFHNVHNPANARLRDEGYSIDYTTAGGLMDQHFGMVMLPQRMAGEPDLGLTYIHEFGHHIQQQMEQYDPNFVRRSNKVLEKHLGPLRDKEGKLDPQKTRTKLGSEYAAQGSDELELLAEANTARFFPDNLRDPTADAPTIAPKVENAMTEIDQIVGKHFPNTNMNPFPETYKIPKMPGTVPKIPRTAEKSIEKGKYGAILGGVAALAVAGGAIIHHERHKKVSSPPQAYTGPTSSSARNGARPHSKSAMGGMAYLQ